MIEQLTIGLAALLSSKSKTKIEECHQMVNGALYDLTGLSEDTFLKLSHKDLISIISGGREINGEKCFALAEMLKLKADVSKDDAARSYNLYLKSFNIFVEVVLSQTNKEHKGHQTINEIICVLRQYKVPDESNLLLFQYYEYTKQYDKAEDVLFKIVTTNKKTKIVDEGFAFYQRLKGKTSIELEKGNLPLDEVIEGLEVYRHLIL